jgi:transposase
MGLIWLTGMNAPDHNSLWRFCNSNKKGLGKVFKESVQVAARCNLVRMVVNAVDGTKIRAASSGDGVVSAKALEKTLERVDRSIAEFMTEVERREDEEMGEYSLPEEMRDALRLKEEIQRALEEVKESGQERVHPREPEARFMKNRRGVELSYNAQAVADQESGIIVAADVVKEASDNGQLVPMLDKVKENVGVVAQENLADGAFFSSSQIGLAEERKYEVLVSAPSSESPASPYSKANPYH